MRSDSGLLGNFTNTKKKLREYLRNLIPQKNNDGIAPTLRVIGESFLPIPERI